jgi:membrane protease YdiL (CAAX protease family)
VHSLYAKPETAINSWLRASRIAKRVSDVSSKLVNLSIFLLIAGLVKLARWGTTNLVWSLTIPYPTPSFIRAALPTLDHNFYRPLFAEVIGVLASLVVLSIGIAFFYPGSWQYLISVDGRFRISRLCFGACTCLAPWCLFFMNESMRGNSLYLGNSFNHVEVWGLALSIIAIQVFAEEYIFRGYLLAGIFTVTRSYLFSACASSILFALVHHPESLADSVQPNPSFSAFCVVNLDASREG